MANYSHRRVTVTRYEWAVPAAEPWGAASEEIEKAWAVAANTYREVNGLPKDAPLSGNAITFHVTDDEVVLTFTHETPAGGAL